MEISAFCIAFCIYVFKEHRSCPTQVQYPTTSLHGHGHCCISNAYDSAMSRWGLERIIEMYVLSLWKLKFQEVRILKIKHMVNPTTGTSSKKYSSPSNAPLT